MPSKKPPVEKKPVPAKRGAPRGKIKPDKKTCEALHDHPNAHPPEVRQQVGRLVRAGVLSYEEIVEHTGVSIATINKWVKQFSWKRDLRPRVREAAAHIEAAKIASEIVSQSQPLTDEEVVDQAARIQVEITGRHKKDLIKSVDLQMQLIEELQIASSHVDKLEEFIVDETKDERNGQRRATLMAAIGIGSRMKAMQAATNSLTSLIKAQRMVYRIADKGESDEEGFEEALKRMAQGLS